MNMQSVRRPVLVSVAAIAALTMTMGGAAAAAKLITGADIKDGSISGADIATNSLSGVDIANNSVTGGDIANNSVTWAEIANGTIRGTEVADKTLDLSKFTESALAELRGNNGGNNGGYAGEHWGVILRNTQADGSAMLRSGPYAGIQDGDGAVTPPRGIGSLQVQTGDGARDKVAFGNEVDYVGKNLSSIDKVGFAVFRTGEDANAAHGGSVDNLPSITFEVDPNLTENPSNYSSLVFVPKGAASDANTWRTFDATDAADGAWFFTGAAGTATSCNMTTMCSWAQIQEKAPAATLYSVAVAKGADHEFQGAVDELVVGADTYDFEPRGVLKH
jgi:hypothetical protein